MFLTMAGTLALAAAPLPDLSRDPDVRCFVAMTYAVGTMQNEADAAKRAGLAGMLMYYLGKIDGRLPSIDLKREVARILKSPSFAQDLPADMARCGKEAQAKGAALKEFGNSFQSTAPALNKRPN